MARPEAASPLLWWGREAAPFVVALDRVHTVAATTILVLHVGNGRSEHVWSDIMCIGNVHRKIHFCGESPHRVTAKYGDKVTPPLLGQKLLVYELVLLNNVIWRIIDWNEVVHAICAFARTSLQIHMCLQLFNLSSVVAGTSDISCISGQVDLICWHHQCTLAFHCIAWDALIDWVRYWRMYDCNPRQNWLESNL